MFLLKTEIELILHSISVKPKKIKMYKSKWNAENLKLIINFVYQNRKQTFKILLK